MKHKRLMILATCLVFVMVCVLCLKELFSVKDITVVYSVTSTEVSEEVLSLLEKYKGESIFGVDTNEISEEITANRYLKVKSVNKKYPNEIVINLTERIEKYYYIAQDATYYFDEEFFIVRKSENPPVNEMLTEISFKNIDGTVIFTECNLKSYFNFPNTFVNDIETVVNGIQDIAFSINQINFVTTQEEGNYRVTLQTKEGVLIEIRKAGDALAEKLASGVAFYKELEENKKIDGTVYVQKDDQGKIVSAHTFR